MAATNAEVEGAVGQNVQSSVHLSALPAGLAPGGVLIVVVAWAWEQIAPENGWAARTAGVHAESRRRRMIGEGRAWKRNHICDRGILQWCQHD